MKKYIIYIIYYIIYDIGVNVWVKECSWEGFLQERVLQVRVYRELVSTPAPLEPENSHHLYQVPRPPLIPANVTHVHFHVSFQACSASKVVSTEIPLFSWAI